MKYSLKKKLGALFLIVVATSLGSNTILGSIIGEGTIYQSFNAIIENIAMYRFSILVELLTSVGIVCLAVYLFLNLRDTNRELSYIALGLWLVEAITLAVSKIGTLGLISLSQEFTAAGSVQSSFFESTGNFLYYGFDRQLNTIHMLFYTAGGIIWYSLMIKSKLVPRVISIFGLTAVSISIFGIMLTILGYEISMFFHLPILPFELVIGSWLLFSKKNNRLQDE